MRASFFKPRRMEFEFPVKIKKQKMFVDFEALISSTGATGTT